jgi:signal recognition particle subunit SEC65
VCLYPIYFDADRSLEHGRKVPKSLAYPKPDARAIVEASKKLRLMVAFEVSYSFIYDIHFIQPTCMHVRVLLLSCICAYT